MPKFSECHSFLVSSEEVNNGPAHSETKQKIPILIPILILILILFSCQVGNTTFTGDQRVSVQVGNYYYYYYYFCECAGFKPKNQLGTQSNPTQPNQLGTSHRKGFFLNIFEFCVLSPSRSFLLTLSCSHFHPPISDHFWLKGKRSLKPL